jgi:hypothetical protein
LIERITLNQDDELNLIPCDLSPLKINSNIRIKPKRTRKSMPREAPSQGSSVYRGVTRYVRQSNQPAGRRLGVLTTR